MIADPSRRALLAGAAGLASAVTSARTGQTTSGSTAPSATSNAEPSILDWGARGNNDPTDGERIQRALDEAPLGGNLHFPPGDFRTRQPLRLRQHLNLIGAGGTRLSGEFDPKSEVALLDVNVEDPGNRDNRNQRIQGLRLSLVSGNGDGLAFRNRAPNIANIGLIIENNLISGTKSGYAIRLEGIGTHHLTVRNNQLIGGVYIASADGVIVEECLIWGDKPGVTLDLIPGAFQTRIIRNAIVTRDGALRVLNGSQVYFEHNQVEQPPRQNRSPEGAHVAIVPSRYGSRHIRIRSNNFGGGDNARLGIHAAGDCQDLLIDDNVFNLNASGVDVSLSDPAVAWTRVGPNNSARRQGVVPRRNSLGGGLSVSDRGTGSFGVKRGAGTMAPTAGWRPDTDFRFWKTLDGIVHFEGDWTAGPATVGRIATLPSGFRPGTTARVMLIGATGDILPIEIGTDGAVTGLRAFTGVVNWAGASFTAALRPPYEASDI